MRDVEGNDYDEGERNEEDEEDNEHDEGTQSEGGDSEGYEDGGARPFILPLIWTINDFYLTMSSKVLENIPIHLPRKFKRCYSGKTAYVGMYDAMFAAGWGRPLTKLNRPLANYLGLSVSQIASNAWRIFIEAEVI